jgi:hypothetical protein
MEIGPAIRVATYTHVLCKTRPIELSSCKHTVGVYNYRVWKTRFPLRSAVRSDLGLTGLLDIYNTTERVQRTFNPIIEELSTDMFYQDAKVAHAIS